MDNKLTLKYYKIHDDSQDLKFHTSGSACFDVAAYLKKGEKVQCYTDYNEFSSIFVGDNSLTIPSGYRVLIPSGLKFDIPDGYSVRTHPRSGTGWKIGLSHPHCEGIVDPDYYHETFLMFFNMTKVSIVVEHNQRIAQLEMVKKLDFSLEETKIEPTQKTDRVGGFGSTGR